MGPMGVVPGTALSILELAPILGLVTLLAVRWCWRWLPPGARRPVTIAAAAVTASSGIAAALLDLRWQLIPVLMAGALVLAFTAVPLLSGRAQPDQPPRPARRWHSTATGYRLTLPGATHLSFTDTPLYLPPLSTVVGTGPRMRWPRLTAEITAVFLDATLRQQPVDLSVTLARHGELVAH
jgi:hypothetical protein